MPGRLGDLLGKVRGLSARERRTVARASFMLPTVWIALRVLPLNRLLPVLRPKTLRRRRSNDQDPATTSRLVEAAARRSPLPTTCLSKSLVLWSLLGRSGIEAEIRIGVLKENDDFAAHAWVEVEGSPVNDAADVGELYDVFADALTSKSG